MKARGVRRRRRSQALIILLEEEEIVRGRDSDNVLLRMPGCVKNLLVEVEAVDGDFVLFPLSTGAHLSGFEHRLWLGNLSRCLQRHFLAGASVKPRKVCSGG